MSLFTYLNGSLVAVSSIRLRADGYQGVQATGSADGTGSQGSIVFDDPTGSLSVTGWMSVAVDEPECTARRLFTGYVADRTYRRGPYRLAAGREIDTTLVDQNAVLSLRLIVNSDGKRPAETDIARINWLLGSAYLSGLVYDVGWIDSSDPRAFDAADYRGMYPADVLNDLCGPRGQIFFAAWDHASSRVGLFYDDPTSTTNTSTLTISNVLSDVNNTTCFGPLIDAEMTVDPSDVVSRLRYTYKGASLVSNNLTTASNFFPSPLVTRGLQITNERVGLTSTATTFSERILAQRSVEAKSITFTVRLPASKVGLIDAGQRIGLRFTHLPGFETLAYSRVERKSLAQSEGTNESYDVTLTCSTYGLTTAIGGGDPGDFPHSAAPASIVQQVSGQTAITMPSPITPGDTLVVVLNSRGNSTWNYAAAGYTLIQVETQTGPAGGSQTLSAYKIAGASESQTLNWVSDIHSGTWYELPGTFTLGAIDTSIGAGSPATSGPVSVAANSIVFAGSAYGQSGSFDAYGGDVSTTPGAGWTEDYDARSASGSPVSWTAHRIETAAGSITGSSTNAVSAPDAFGVGTTNWAAQVFAFVGAVGNDPPAPGTWVYGEVASMAGAVGTLDFGYAAGSLSIRVDGVLISPASYTETNPAAGTFTLDWVPDSDEVVTVSYQGH